MSTVERLKPLFMRNTKKTQVAQRDIPDGIIIPDASLETTVHGRPTVDSTLGNEFFSTDLRPVILFDGECSLCNGGVQIMLDLDTEGIFRYASLHSTAGATLLRRCGRGAEDSSSLVLVAEDRHWVKSQAILSVFGRLPVPLPVLQSFLQPLPGDFRDSVYEWIAANRYLFGESNSCRMMAPEWRDRFLY